MTAMERIEKCGIVPVVVLENARDAVPAAAAMLEQCRQAVRCGAQFIVSPGLNEEVVRWCTEHGVAVLPGCVTPTEIMAALRLGLNAVKFFPANVYGGLSGMKALSAPFGGVRFIPTGGVSAANLKAVFRAFRSGLSPASH